MTAGRTTVGQCVVHLDNPAISLRMFGERSSLGWLLREFSRFGVSDILLLTGRMPLDLRTALPREMRIAHAPVTAGTGTGGGLFQVRDQLCDRFLLCGSDQLFDWNLANLLAEAAVDDPHVVGRLIQDAGIGLFRRHIVDHLRPVCSLEGDVLPDLAGRDLLRITTMPGAHKPLRLQASDDMIVRLRRRALFLDRDGVLNLDHGYVGSPDRFEWMDGALDAIRYATEAGWHVFVVTNQSGVARGLYTEDAVRHLLDWMADQARAAGGTIDDVRFCPFHPEATLDAYRQAHPWRKPRPGMLLDLIHAWNLDPKQAVMVGDQTSDMQAAAAAGVAGHLFDGGNLLGFLRPILDHPA
jgi:D,D-heptose 1,7-bisphosphate phosphatase